LYQGICNYTKGFLIFFFFAYKEKYSLTKKFNSVKKCNVFIKKKPQQASAFENQKV